MEKLSIRNFTRRTAPRAPFAVLAKAVLPGWEVSLAFVGPTDAQKLNKKLRKKNYTPNVLAYECGAKSGEIIICLSVAKTQAPDYGMTYQKFVPYLFIHALLHLKGYQHGTTMEKRERALMAHYLRAHHPHEATHRNRH